MNKKVAYIFFRQVSESDTFSISDLKNLNREGLEINVFAILHKKKGSKKIYKNKDINLHKINYLSFLNILYMPLVFIDTLFFVLRNNKFNFKSLFKNLFIIPSSLDILRNLKKLKPDVVHLFWGHYPALVGYLVHKYLVESKLSMFLGAYDIYYENPISEIVAKSSDFLVTHSSKNIEIIKNKFNVDRKIEVIKRGVDLSDFNLSDALRIKNNYSIIYAGRLIKEKNIELIIDTFSEIYKNYPELTLDIYGDGNYKNYLKKYAFQKLPVEKVKFNGFVQQKKLIDIYMKSNIFIMTSTKDGEVLPNALKEAMCAGCICITTKTLGIEELIDDGVNGFIVQNEVNDVINKTKYILNLQENEVEFIRTCAQNKIIRHFSAEASMNAYIELWGLGS